MKKLLLALVFLSISTVGYAQIHIMQVKSLRGLEGVLVLIEEIAPDVESDGLSRNAIQTDVELKLRLAGIKVLSSEEWAANVSAPCFSVNVNAMLLDIGLYVYHISVQLDQRVAMLRDPYELIMANSWITSSTGTVGKINVSSIRDKVKDHVDIFINDYLTANPK